MLMPVYLDLIPSNAYAYIPMTEASHTAYTDKDWITRHQQVCEYNLADFEADDPIVPGYQCIYEVVTILLASFHRGKYIVPLAHTLRVILTTLVFPEANEHNQLRNKCHYLLTKYLKALEAGPTDDDDEARDAALVETFNTVLSDFIKIKRTLIDSFFSKVSKPVVKEASPKQTPSSTKDDKPDVIYVSEDEEEEEDEDEGVADDSNEVVVVEDHPEAVDAEINHVIKRRLEHEAQMRLALPEPQAVSSPHKRKGKDLTPSASNSTGWSQIRLDHGEKLGRLPLIGQRLLKLHSSYSFWDMMVWWGWVGHQCSKMQTRGHPTAVETWAYQYFECYSQFIGIIMHYLRLGVLPRLSQEIVQQLSNSRSQCAVRASEICFSGVDGKDMNPKPRGPYGHETGRVCQELELFEDEYTKLRPQTATADIELVLTWYRLIDLLATQLPKEKWATLVAARFHQCNKVIIEEFFEFAGEVAAEFEFDEPSTILEDDLIQWALHLATAMLKLMCPYADIKGPVVTELEMIELIKGDAPMMMIYDDPRQRMVIYRFLVQVYKPKNLLQYVDDYHQSDYYREIGGSLYYE